MPWLSGKYNFGDRSALTRFVTGLDEALEDYRGLDDPSLSRGTGAVHDPWSEDLFVPHLPVGPQGTGAREVEPEALGPGPRADTPGVRVRFRAGGLEGDPVQPAIPRSRRFARVVSVAGLLVAAQAWPVRRGFVPRPTDSSRDPMAARAKGRRPRSVGFPSRELH
jgi:hypothetical protein